MPGREELLERLVLEIGGDISGVVNKLLDLQAEIDKTERTQKTQWKRLSEEAQKYGAMLGGFVKQQLQAQVASLFEQAKAAVKVAESYEKMSQRLGVTSEFLSTMSHAATIAGASIELLEKGSRKLAQNLQATGETGAEFRAVLAGIGVDASKFEAMNPEEQFLALAEALSGFQDDGNKAAIVMRLLGEEAGPRLIPLLNLGRDGIEKLRQEARDLGVEVSTQFSRQSAEMLDNLARLEARSQGFANVIAQATVPELNRLLGAFLEGARAGGAMAGSIRLLETAWRDWSGMLTGTGDPISNARTQLKGVEAELLRLRSGLSSAQSSRVPTSILGALGLDQASIRLAIQDQEALRRSLEATIAREEKRRGLEAAEAERKRKLELDLEAARAKRLAEDEAIKEAVRQSKRDEEEAIRIDEANVAKLERLREETDLLAGRNEIEKDAIRLKAEAAKIGEESLRQEFERAAQEFLAAKRAQEAARERETAQKKLLDDGQRQLDQLASLAERRAADIQLAKDYAAVNEGAAAKLEETIARINKGYDEQEKRATKAMQVIKTETTRASQEMRGAFVDLLLDPVNKGFDDLANSWVSSLKRMAAEQLASGIFGRGGGPLGLFASPQRRAGGGPIVGPGGPTEDRVPILASAGEFMHRAAAVSYYGVDFMRAVNEMRLPRVPRFAEGGLVTSAVPVASAAGAGTTVLDLAIVNVENEAAVFRALGSPRARDIVFNHMGEGGGHRARKVLGLS